MTKTLDVRIKSAKDILKEIEVSYLKSGCLARQSKTKDYIEDLLKKRHEINGWLNDFTAREGIRNILNKLQDNVDAAGSVDIMGTKMQFHHARSFIIRAYLTVTWALADSITNFVGLVFCPLEPAKNPVIPPKLVQHFIQKNKYTTAILFISMSECYGWPIGLAYVIRNRLIHNGENIDDRAFFDNLYDFEISDKEWTNIKLKAEEYGVTSVCHRASEKWPWPQNDLRQLLYICEREIDSCLGILLETACETFRSYLKNLL